MRTRHAPLWRVVTGAVLCNELARDAALWNLLLLGEAAKQVPEHIRLEHSVIEWRKIAGFRDMLAHGYFWLDEDIIWDVIEN